MRSIPVAMSWELLDRGRWSLPAAALGALAFPVILLAALGYEGALDPQTQPMLVMHLIMVQMNVAVFGGALVASGWKLSALYAMPATAATLVLWRLIPSMTLMAVETVVWTSVLNALFDLNWPLWEPALLAAVAVAAVNAAVWVTERSRWIVLALIIVSAVLGLWLNSRYGSTFSGPIRPWTTVTPIAALTLLAFAAISFVVGTRGVARNRRGEAPFSTGLVARVEQLLDPTPAPRPPFRSAGHAQFWFAWNKGWLMPVIAAVALAVCLVVMLFSDLNSNELVEGAWLFSRFMPVIALLGGVAMGNAGTAPDYAMGHFLATRPMTSAHMARIALRAGALSLLLAWVLWAAAMALVYGALVAFRAAPSPMFPQALDWRELPASFLGSWVVLGVWMSMLLTGRSRPFLRLLGELCAAYIGLMLLGRFAMSQAARELMLQIMVGVVGALLVVLTTSLFIAAWRRGHIDGRTVATAFAVWMFLGAAGGILLPPSASVPQAAYVLAVGLLGLVVAPVAGAPLAVAWNRTR